MKENAIKKINTMGKVGGIVTIIAKVVCIIGLIGLLVSTVFVAAIPREFIQFKVGGQGTVMVDLGAIGQSLSEEERERINGGEMLEQGNLQLNFNGSSIEYNKLSAEGDVITFSAVSDDITSVSLHDLVSVLIVCIIHVAMTLVSVFFAGFLCKALKNCESPFEEKVIHTMRNFAYSLIPWVILKSITESVTGSYMSGKMEVSISLDWIMLIIVLVILVLVYIFRYGAVLQQESDETL